MKRLGAMAIILPVLATVVTAMLSHAVPGIANVSGSIAVAAKDRVDRVDRTRKLAGASYGHSTIKIAFSISLTGTHKVPFGFKEQVDVTNYMWTTTVQNQPELFEIGREAPHFEITYDDDQSELARVIAIYRYRSGLSFEYNTAITTAFSPLDPKADVLWGPSNPQFAKVAVSIAKEAHLPIIMWAQNELIYRITPGWSQFGIAQSQNIKINEKDGPNESTMIEMLPDRNNRGDDGCPQNITDLEAQLEIMSGPDAWKFVDMDVLRQSANHAKMHNLLDDKDLDIEMQIQNAVTLLTEVNYERWSKGEPCEKDKYGDSTFIQSAKECWKAFSVVRPRNVMEFDQKTSSDMSYPFGCSYNNIFNASSRNYSYIVRYNEFSGTPPNTSSYSSICRKGHRKAKDELKRVIDLLHSEIDRLKDLPECGGRGRQFPHGGIVPFEELPEWVQVNSGAPYEVLLQELKNRSLNQFENTTRGAVSDEQVSWRELLGNALIKTLHDNVHFMQEEARKRSRKIVEIFDTVHNGNATADMDGPSWDIGYKYAYDVNPPESLVLTDVIQRLQPKTGGGRAWFFSDPGVTEEGIRGQFTCVAGARQAMALNYSEVLVQTFVFEEARQWMTYMDFYGMPEALVLCGGISFTMNILLMMKAFDVEPKSVVVTTKRMQELVSTLAGNKVNYILQPLPFPIFNPALESYLFSYQTFRTTRYSKSEKSRQFRVWKKAHSFGPHDDDPTTEKLFGIDGYGSLVSHQISAAASLVTYAAVVKTLNNFGSFDGLEPKDFTEAFCPQHTKRPPYGSPMELPTEMGTIRFNCKSDYKPGKRVEAIRATTHPRNTMSSTRQLLPLARDQDSMKRYFDSQAVIVANKDDVSGTVVSPLNGIAFIAGANEPLALVGSAELIYPMVLWADKELQVYPCKPGCFFAVADAQCKACPPGKYRAESTACEPCRIEVKEDGSEIKSYSDGWGFPKCLEVPQGSTFRGVKQTPLASPDYYHLNLFPCSADYGSKKGDANCCNQAGVVKDMAWVCPTRRPFCVDYQGGEHWGRCQAIPARAGGAIVEAICDIDDAGEYQMAKLSDDLPLCTFTDGSRESLVYPCTCGSVVCKHRTVCYKRSSVCMKELTEPMFAKCNSGLCIGGNRCREGNTGAMCLACEEGYENESIEAIMQGRACLKCAHKVTIVFCMMLVILFWACCVWTLSYLFVCDAPKVMSVRGPVVRILITYFQLVGIVSEMISTGDPDSFTPANRLWLGNLENWRVWLQFLFLRPFDMISFDCILGQLITKSERSHLNRINTTIALTVFVFLAGVCSIILFNVLRMIARLFQATTPMVKIWGKKGHFYFIFNCFPTFVDRNGSTRVRTRSSRRAAHKYESTGMHSYSIDDTSKDEDDIHYFEKGAGHDYAKALLVNEGMMLSSDTIRQLTAWTLLMYPVVARKMVHLIGCHHDKFPTPRLMKRLEVVCYSVVHKEYFFTGVGVALLWGLTVPVLFVYVGLKNQGVDADSVKRRASYGLVLQGYRPKVCWWQAWIMARTCILIGCSCLGYRLMRAIFSWAVLFVSLVMHVTYQPYVTCERFGLWHLEVYMLLAVIATFTISLWKMYMTYKDGENPSLSWPYKHIMKGTLASLYCLEFILACMTIFYGLWLVLVCTVNPHVKVHKEHRGTRNISLVYRLYGKLVHYSRGMNSVIVGWHRAGEKYIDVQRLTRGERRFLIFNLKETMQACFEASPCFAPALLSIAFHEAFRRAIIGRQANAQAIHHDTLGSSKHGILSKHSKGRTVIRRKMISLSNRIEHITQYMLTLEAKEKTSDCHRARKINAEILKQQKTIKDFELELQNLQEFENVRYDFAVEFSGEYMAEFNSELTKLIDRLKTKGFSRVEVEGGLTVMDCMGRELWELRWLDECSFPICARFDNSKQVTVEELSAALADVNIDISAMHPEFVRHFPNPVEKKNKESIERKCGPIQPQTESGGESVTRCRLCPQRCQKRQTAQPSQTEPVQAKTKSKQYDQSVSSLTSVSTNSSKDAKARAEEWARYEDLWWRRARPTSSWQQGTDAQLKPYFQDDSHIKPKNPEAEVWEKAAESLTESWNLELAQDGAQSLEALKLTLKTERKYNESLLQKLFNHGVDLDNCAVSDVIEPIESCHGELPNHNKDLFTRDLVRITDKLQEHATFKIRVPAEATSKRGENIAGLRPGAFSNDSSQDLVPVVASPEPSAPLRLSLEAVGDKLLPYSRFSREDENMVVQPHLTERAQIYRAAAMPESQTLLVPPLRFSEIFGTRDGVVSGTMPAMQDNSPTVESTDVCTSRTPTARVIDKEHTGDSEWSMPPESDDVRIDDERNVPSVDAASYAKRFLGWLG